MGKHRQSSNPRSLAQHIKGPETHRQSNATRPGYHGGLTTSPRHAVDTVDDSQFHRLQACSRSGSRASLHDSRSGSSLSLTSDDSRTQRHNHRPLSHSQRRRTVSESDRPSTSSPNPNSWLVTMSSPSRRSPDKTYATTAGSPPRFPSGSRADLFPPLERATLKPKPVRPTSYAAAVKTPAAKP